MTEFLDIRGEEYHDPHDDIYIDRLHLAFKTAFRWIHKREDAGEDLDFADAWADLIASGLDGVRINALPAIDRENPGLPFIETHRIETESYVVARSGMRGGPNIDVLLQVWFDTEDMLCGYGVPLVFCKIANSGRLPPVMWSELQDICRQVTLATPSGRLIFRSEDGPFDSFKFSSYVRGTWMFATDMHSFAGGRLPPSPVRGRLMDDFCLDLASGWIGDPALSGQTASPLLDELMSMFTISHVLRIKIIREGS